MTHDFKLPIQTVSHYVIDNAILKDLEVTESKCQGNSAAGCLYDILYKPTHKVDYLVKEGLSETYTTDVSFIRQTQTFISSVTADVSGLERDRLTTAYDAIEEIMEEQDFHSKYQYIEVGMFKSLNNSTHFMQMLSFYNMLSPVITLLTPIVILILPFFLIRYQGVTLSLKAYLGTIKHILRNHAIGQLASSFGSVSWDKRIYLLITVTFYILQVYQNALSCYRFTTNMSHIHKQLFVIRDYLRDTCSVINQVKEVVAADSLETYAGFVEANDRALLSLRTLLAEIECVTPLRVSISKACQVGDVMRLYYSIRHDDGIRQALDYSFKLNAYISAMTTIGNNNSLRNVELRVKGGEDGDESDGGIKWETKNMKYPHHMESPSTETQDCLAVGNDFKLNRPMILTGPNASGKTTLLKSAILNTLLSQQIGCGFYDKLVMTPYDKFHCYLDVPDTSGRDSLFQAEAKRCLSVINDVADDETRVFCVFDELYSGTNPAEATASAYAMTKHLSKHKNATFVITTHFYDFCRLCKKNKVRVRNFQMGWKGDDGGADGSSDSACGVEFTYKMKSGISSLRGGVRVLKQTGYPRSVVDDATKVIKDYV